MAARKPFSLNYLAVPCWVVRVPRCPRCSACLNRPQPIVNYHGMVDLIYRGRYIVLVKLSLLKFNPSLVVELWNAATLTASKIPMSLIGVNTLKLTLALNWLNSGEEGRHICSEL